MKKRVEVLIDVDVIIDESKFTQTFMAEFRGGHYNFHTVDQHICHLAQLYARGLADNNQSIEGYGPAKDMGIVFETIGQDEEISQEIEEHSDAQEG